LLGAPVQGEHRIARADHEMRGALGARRLGEPGRVSGIREARNGQRASEHGGLQAVAVGDAPPRRCGSEQPQLTAEVDVAHGIGIEKPLQRLRFSGTDPPDGQLCHGSIVPRGGLRAAWEGKAPSADTRLALAPSSSLPEVLQ
jgi:hypothetical protein